MADKSYETDVITTSAGDLAMTFLGHGTLMFTFNEKVIHIDPFSRVADYAELPEADLVLITHEHQDHLDLAALGQIVTDDTVVILTEICVDRVEDSVGDFVVLEAGDVYAAAGVKVEAVPAYNIAHTRPNGQAFHPKGNGVGYVLTFGDTTVYIAGDTEGTPEMRALTGIDVAFLPMNLPYTMTPEQVADAARAFKPKLLYPYHFGDTDTGKLVELLRDEPGIEVRVRDLA
ncbi:MAG: MBL fold metallo-hydrolase [Anaerolineae bacterium]|nr:MBL fold metallo-hydrolase [Anaerolineae bacterium]